MRALTIRSGYISIYTQLVSECIRKTLKPGAKSNRLASVSTVCSKFQLGLRLKRLDRFFLPGHAPDVMGVKESGDRLGMCIELPCEALPRTLDACLSAVWSTHFTLRKDITTGQVLTVIYDSN